MLNITRTNPNPNVYNSTKRNYTNRIADGGLVEKMIRDLKITDANQKKWLYENESEANDLRKDADMTKKNGITPNNQKEFTRKIISFYLDLDSLKSKINHRSFDPIKHRWLGDIREIHERIFDYLESSPSSSGLDWEKNLNSYIDRLMTKALTKTALNFNPTANKDSEKVKIDNFKNNAKKGVGNLLYEFANGLGKDIRNFSLDTDFTQKFLEGNVASDIKDDFFNVLKRKNLTFERFVKNGNRLDGRYGFSPDHTGLIDSIEKHINANVVQFFIGGTAARYFPSDEKGWIIVELRNPTGRNSLLLHKAKDYNRDGTGNNRPLSTILQIMRFKLKVK